MIGVCLANHFDSEVVDDKVENGGAGDVAEEAGCMAGWDVTIVGEVLDKFNVREPSGLRKTVHSGTDFGKDSVVFYQRSEIVLIHDVIGDGPGWDVEILVLAGVVKRGDEVEVGEIKAEKGGRGG